MSPPTFVAAGTSASGSSSVAPGLPAGLALRDIMLAIVANKYPANGPATPSGWTLLGQLSGGAGAAGADSGSVYGTAYLKVADAADVAAAGSGTVTINIGSGNSAAARIYAWRKATSTSTWHVDLVSGTDSTGAGNWSAPASSSLDFAVDDLLVFASAINGDAPTMTSPFGIAATGITFGTQGNRGGVSTTVGDDCQMLVRDAPVTAGSGTQAPTFTCSATGTTTNSPAGVTLYVRLREDPAVTVTETVAVTEAASGQLQASATVSEAVTVSESAAAQLQAVATVTEEVTLTESASGALVSSALLTEEVTLSETASGQLQASVTVSEEVAISESASGQLATSAVVGESVDVSEAASGQLTAGAVLAEEVTLAEALAVQAALFAEVSETVTLAEELATQADMFETVSEVVTVEESLLVKPWRVDQVGGAARPNHRGGAAILNEQAGGARVLKEGE